MEDTPAVSGGELAGRYTIERELGRGGAATVYLAHDRREDRKVALKVLHGELAQAIGAQRFLREIKHSSSLHHPHLLDIHDSGEDAGRLYYVMPYMRDGSLRSRIAKEKQLSLEAALSITSQIGDALTYAHGQGVVHRDIKPDNVLFSADHACLADFGIARAVDSVAADTLTSTGLVVGTPAYMSPEQASGEREVGARSDQYSLACLLYEMITGLPPFIGATQQSVISQRFTQPPPSMRAHRPSVPENVERAVKRAMAVVPADRFAGVQEFVDALRDSSAAAERPLPRPGRRRWVAGAAVATAVAIAALTAGPGGNWFRSVVAPVDPERLVVLPFLSEGDSSASARVTSAMYAGLDRWEDLALTSDMAVRDVVGDKGAVTTLDEAYRIARALGAGRAIWGRVTEDGGRMTVHADLYDVTNKEGRGEKRIVVLDAQAVDPSMRSLAASLLAAGPVPRGMDTGEDGTTSYAAWTMYRSGAAALAEWKLEQADTLFARAVEADRDFAAAHYWSARVASWLRPADVRGWGLNAARAVALNGKLRGNDGRRANALLSMSRGDFPQACEQYAHLARVDSLDATAWYGQGECMHADTLVIRGGGPGGYRFRSSWHTAGVSMLRALEIEPRMHAIPHFRRLRQLFPGESTRIRLGGYDRMAFAAYPELSGDTLAFNPRPRPEFEKGQSPQQRARQQLAVRRNRKTLQSLAATWTSAYPESHEAHVSRAAILEVSGELNEALASLARARRLPAPDADRLGAAESEARVRLKNGDFAAARLVADSALRRFPVSAESWEQIARLAGMTGNVAKMSEALRFYWHDFANVDDLDPKVAHLAGELMARASFGECTSDISRLESELEAGIRIRVHPDRHAEIRERVANASATFLMRCTQGRSMAAVGSLDERVRNAQRLYGRGDLSAARAEVAAIAQGRSQSRPGDVSVNLIAREVWLRLALGDTVSALGAMDGVLTALETISAAVLSHPLENALLARLMADRADLAAAAGDAPMARRWATPVAALWTGADRSLQPTVERMRRLSVAR